MKCWDAFRKNDPTFFTMTASQQQLAVELFAQHNQYKKSPKRIWLEYFAGNTPSDVEIREAVSRLANKNKFDHVIALIESALIQGQARPWMYNVLIGAMQIEGRPVKEIDRIRASAVDLSQNDVANILVMSAQFKKSGSIQLALRLCRQASLLSPERPEPYVLGLKSARELKKLDAIRWACVGILVNAWTPDYVRLHQEALDSAEEAILELRARQKNDEADRFAKEIEAAQVRDLSMKLSWSGTGDLDLVVEEPLGSFCSFDHRQSPGGGVLTHDGYGPNQNNCFEEYICAKGFPGKYRVTIRHVHGDIVGKRAIMTVVRKKGSPEESSRQYEIPITERNSVLRLSLPEGRRTFPSETQLIVEISDLKRPEYTTLRKKIGSESRASRRARNRFARSRRIRGGGSRPASGYQPIVSIIPEGIGFGTAAVISADRRFVKLSVAPSFSTITDVFTFSFVNGGNIVGGGGGIGGGGGFGGIGGGGIGGGGGFGGIGGGGIGGAGGGVGGGFFSVPVEQIVPR